MAGHERFLVSFCNQPDELMCPLALFTGGLTRPALVPLPGLAWQGVAGATGVACDSTHVYVALQRRPARDTAGTPGRCPPPDDGPAATLVILRRDTLEPVGEHRFSLAADVHSMLAAPGLVLAVSRRPMPWWR